MFQSVTASRLKRSWLPGVTTVPGRLHERSMSVFDRLRPLNDQKSSETIKKGQERLTAREVERSETLA